MPKNFSKCEAFWAQVVRSLSPNDPRRSAVPDAFGFGGEGQLADELAILGVAVVVMFLRRRLHRAGRPAA